jgi:hypothetical protein
MSSKNIIKLNEFYNCKITDDNGMGYHVFANQIYNNNLHHWEGWKCDVGIETMTIDYDMRVYDGFCKNKCIGDLSEGLLEIPSEPTICRRKHCTPCTSDLETSKRT